MIDGRPEIDVVTRSVGTAPAETTVGRTITLSRPFAVPVSRLWSSCTSADEIGSWFLPVSGDLQLYGRYQLEGNAGGQITTCDPEREFTATWEYDAESSSIDVSFASAGDGSVLTVQHDSEPSDEMWEQYGPGALGIGWDLTILGLANYLETGEPVDPRETLDWTLSEAGHEFVGLAAAAWEAADIATGTPHKQAKAAAERSRTAYLALEDER
ncbi:activator of HSP90 ATPase [Rhodococcus rhodnii]|uniref:Activator of Hsp90 ATPase homologue 1/2-like C-terminal domain-containing protein n=2 Tax=Rhodococcus rhodnii TaxID=38312 RepID=R7WP98_9NOCA|nr:SRPBCC domain-containing protein [Rhodococcus rhodnii]EOM77142.1 hypothetical protein Rrhod_1512 [Rhodococcus rhodnii LMG 5362]TXG92133.1 activator of HSP90 ATPase [Rhodococcus rhodnii]